MTRTALAVIFLLLACAATSLPAASLSVGSLAEALKNPALLDTKAETFLPALAPIQDALLNQPSGDDESSAFRQRISDIARHRDTRVGKLFFAALAATPAIEKLPDDAGFAAVEASWPLALGAKARVRVEWTLSGKAWRISDLHVMLEGLAAAPVAGMAPYFGSGALRESMLDLEVIDYLVGRDASDRELPASERPAFDYDAALAAIFKSETGAIAALLDDLTAGLGPQVGRDNRLQALKPHLAGEAEFEAIKEAATDPQRAEAFWITVMDQLKQAGEGPRPSSVPEAAGAAVRVRWRTTGDQGKPEGACAVLRLESGKLSLRGLGTED